MICPDSFNCFSTRQTPILTCLRSLSFASFPETYFTISRIRNARPGYAPIKSIISCAYFIDPTPAQPKDKHYVRSLHTNSRIASDGAPRQPFHCANVQTPTDAHIRHPQSGAPTAAPASELPAQPSAHALHSVAAGAHHRPNPARGKNERSGLAPSLAPASPDAPDIPPTSSTAPNSASRDRPRREWGFRVYRASYFPTLNNAFHY